MLPLSSFREDPSRVYLNVRLERAMTISELMSKYLLNEYDCNDEQFRKINNLTSKTASLSKNKIYNLPIWIYDYNGKSIRSSIGNSDLDLAKKIQSYNVDLQKKGVRTQSYQQNKYIYVPYHFFNCLDKRKKNILEDEPVFVEGSEKVRGVATRTYAIFGRKYQDVPLLDKKLRGRIFYVEGGHGSFRDAADCGH